MAGSLWLGVCRGETRRLAAVGRQTSYLTAALGAQSALALASSLLRGIGLAALSSPLPSHLAALFITLVDDSVASVRISVLKLCFGSCLRSYKVILRTYISAGLTIFDN